MNPTLDLLQALIRRPSITPDDAGCQALIAGRPSAAHPGSALDPAEPEGESSTSSSPASDDAGSEPASGSASTCSITCRRQW